MPKSPPGLVHNHKPIVNYLCRDDVERRVSIIWDINKYAVIVSQILKNCSVFFREDIIRAGIASGLGSSPPLSAEFRECIKLTRIALQHAAHVGIIFLRFYHPAPPSGLPAQPGQASSRLSRRHLRRDLH
jgi:hypothetical protein